MKLYEILESFEYLGKLYLPGDFISENILNEMKIACENSKELNESIHNRISKESVDLLLG